MSNTRHAPTGSPPHPARYASSRELAIELHGNLVARRCEVLESREDRELVFALQSFINDVGADAFAGSILKRFDARLGTSSMRRFNLKPESVCMADKVKAIRKELPMDSDFVYHDFLLRGEVYCGVTIEQWLKNPFGGSRAPFAIDALLDPPPQVSAQEKERTIRKAMREPNSYPASDFFKICREAATANQKGLSAYLKQICLDPKSNLDAGPWYFHDLISCLRELLEGNPIDQAARFRDGFTSTKLSRAIWDEIEAAHRDGGAVLLHNDSGNGKSYAAAAYASAYPGRARYVLTPATNNEVDFWRAISGAFGTALGMSFKCDQIRARSIQAILGSGTVLILDNAEHLFPVRDYRYALPTRLNQVLELAERGVSVVLIARSKLFDTLGFVEARTGWDRSKFVSQINRGVIELPNELAKEDVRSVAATLLSEGDRAAQHKLADYMIASPGYLHSGKPAAQRARHAATAAGRQSVTLNDLEKVIDTWIKPGLKGIESGLQRADAAKGKTKSVARNWRPETEAQLARKDERRRNPIVTSSDMVAPLAQAGRQRAGDEFSAVCAKRAATINRLNQPSDLEAVPV